MRRFILVAALLGLTACGGEEMPLEEAPALVSEARAGQVAEPASAEANAIICTGSSWECYCNSLKTEERCRTVPSCVWAFNKCSPTYE
ncbi:hypothetical protein JRI60_07950 [Archangium violaceum]|uniref:hypothetical protein n=1 Tax=Archangium violaceum TaxID=83451 RepID=UPI001950ECC8|nr:hypothetical protein [Archangium violaceum]QRN98952.1 hypothetical protein JRI60_07950 [Archangium violaceum]